MYRQSCWWHLCPSRAHWHGLYHPSLGLPSPALPPTVILNPPSPLHQRAHSYVSVCVCLHASGPSCVYRVCVFKSCPDQPRPCLPVAQCAQQGTWYGTSLFLCWMQGEQIQSLQAGRQCGTCDSGELSLMWQDITNTWGISWWWQSLLKCYRICTNFTFFQDNKIYFLNFMATKSHLDYLL